MRRIVGLGIMVSGLCGAASAVWAEVPVVVTDIAPVHALAASVMDGVGEPTLLLPAGASPHAFDLRPSDARRLARADLLVAVGPELTPWLYTAVEKLASDAEILSLFDLPSASRLPMREGVSLRVEGGSAEQDDHAGHDDHDDHGKHDEHDKHADHDHDGHDDHHGHDEHHHEGGDPHAWLSPANAALWVDAIATRLSTLDPENAAIYRANADAERDALNALSGDIRARFASLQDARVFVFHDALQYFEVTAGIAAAGAVTPGDDATTGARRLSEARAGLANATNACLFVSSEVPAKTLRLLMRDAPDLRVVEIDFLGADLAPGAALYRTMLTRLSDTIAGCLEAGG